MRILALDFGTKRIGLALSDELLITAQGMDSIYRKNLQADLNTISTIAKENNVSEVVVGLPLNMNGSPGDKAKEVMEFIDNLAKVIDISIKTWDERLTSIQAERTLLEADISRAKRKRFSDKLAAQIILQSYLDSRKAG